MTQPVSCPACAAEVRGDDRFCEACGADLNESGTSTSPPGSTADSAGGAVPSSAACTACGGAVDDGYCTVCGVKAPTARDHWVEEPATWLGGVCDRGILHARNEDAMALAAIAVPAVDQGPGTTGSHGATGVLVVCDGVTTAPDSDRAALAAARAACANLRASAGPDAVGAAAVVSHWDGMLRQAVRSANAEAVGAAHVLGDPPEPPSCTIVAAVISGDPAQPGATGGPMLHVAWCGDSRCYWVPDVGNAVQVTTDHSLGTKLMRAGLTQAEAEQDGRFHTITRWLGADSVDPTPDTAALALDAPGYVAVVSDGLWNYASAPAALAAAVRRVLEDLGPSSAPAALAQQLVDFANGQGGHDNITVALARIGGVPAPEPATGDV